MRMVHAEILLPSVLHFVCATNSASAALFGQFSLVPRSVYAKILLKTIATVKLSATSRTHRLFRCELHCEQPMLSISTPAIALLSLFLIFLIGDAVSPQHRTATHPCVADFLANIFWDIPASKKPRGMVNIPEFLPCLFRYLLAYVRQSILLYLLWRLLPASTRVAYLPSVLFCSLELWPCHRGNLYSNYTTMATIATGLPITLL